MLPPEEVLDLLDKKIATICRDTEATEPPILFLSDNQWLVDQDNKRRKKRGEEPREFIPNFRYSVAKTKPYKGNRNNPKPFHFYNIMAYMLATYKCVVSDYGYEADDMMCIEQTSRVQQTIICSRDKDLRICPGWHYSWECGKQGAIYPTETDRIGWLEKKDNGDILGYGLSFFYYQMLVGDSADNIPGLPGVGKVGAYNALFDKKDEKELFETVKFLYKAELGESSKDYFLEQANLLHMVQEVGVGYRIPKFS